MPSLYPTFKTSFMAPKKQCDVFTHMAESMKIATAKEQDQFHKKKKIDDDKKKRRDAKTNVFCSIIVVFHVFLP